MRTAGAAVPPQFTQWCSQPGRSSGSGCNGRTRAGLLSLGFLQQMHRATSAVVCCGGFQPLVPRPATSFSISVRSAYYSRLLCRLYSCGRGESSGVGAESRLVQGCASFPSWIYVSLFESVLQMRRALALNLLVILVIMLLVCLAAACWIRHRQHAPCQCPGFKESQR